VPATTGRHGGSGGGLATAMQGDGTTSVIQIEPLTRARVPELAELMVHAQSFRTV
jgi:hypothetical protein